ncbi:helicase [Aureococcus anophagefferens]|nr:helicase [Aureococcus anophagefferens]
MSASELTHEALRVANTKAAARRRASRVREARGAPFKYLLRQSGLYEFFKDGFFDKGDDEPVAEAPAAGKAGSRRSSGSKSKPHEDERVVDDDDAPPDFLQVQPACITGAMRPYQLAGASRRVPDARRRRKKPSLFPLGLNWMIRLRNNGLNGILADEMGLGKTLQSISMLGYLHEFKRINGPHLVLVPKTTLSNWMNEFRRWLPALTAFKFHGSKEERGYMTSGILVSEPRAWDVVVTTYEVANLEKTALAKIAWRFVIIDEAHRIKNENAQLSKTVRLLRTENRLLITGTPLQNNLHELWALLNFLLPDVFQSAERFDDLFDLQIDDADAKQRLIGQLHKLLRPFVLRRLKADVEKSLPPKSETILFTSMTATQRDVYKQCLLREIDVVQGGSGKGGGRTAVLNLVMQLRKCCNHPYLFPNVEDRSLPVLGEHLVGACGKLVLLDKLLTRLKDKGHRVLIFSQMTRMLDILEDFMVMRAYDYCRIDGKTAHELREEYIDAYNAPNSEKFAFLLSTRAGGLGINLQTADTCVLYDSDWNPQADLQAMDRCHRIGQTKPVHVYRLVTEHSQGRLHDKERKLQTDELLHAVRFGADKVFRGGGDASELSDLDIDAIIARGRTRTADLEARLEASEKGDMLDFKLDGGMATQQWEGVDYAAVQDQKKRGLDANPGKGSMDDFQFFEGRERLYQLHAVEEARFADLQSTPEKKAALAADHAALRGGLQLLDAKDQKEKETLMTRGFTTWTKQHYTLFLRASARHGRDAYDRIAADLYGKSPRKSAAEVARYAAVFWKRGASVFAPSDWDRISRAVEKGEKKLEEMDGLMAATRKFVELFARDPSDLQFRFASTAAGLPQFPGLPSRADEERVLLQLVCEHGYGNWRRIRADFRSRPEFQFDWFLRSLDAEAVGKRCEALMRAAEKEYAELERRHEAYVAAVNALAAARQGAPRDPETGKPLSQPERVARMFEKMADDHKKQADLRNELKAQKLAKSAEQRALAKGAARAAAAAPPPPAPEVAAAPPPEKRPLAPDAPHAPPRKRPFKPAGDAEHPPRRWAGEAPKKPRSALRCFMRNHVRELRKHPGAPEAQLKQILTAMFEKAPPEERREMERRSELDKVRYEREYAEYLARAARPSVRQCVLGTSNLRTSPA